MPVPAPASAFLSTPTIPLHRVRFFDHTPSPITALAFSPTPLPAASDPAAKGKAKQLSHEASNELGVLVIARENGEVEIWEWVAPEESSMGNWVMEKVCQLKICLGRSNPFAGVTANSDTSGCISDGLGDQRSDFILAKVISCAQASGLEALHLRLGLWRSR